LDNIIKNNIQITKYNATLIKGYKTISYKFEAILIQFELLSACTNSLDITQLSPTNLSAINLAETIIITQIIQNTTNLIQSFTDSSLLEVIILYHHTKAIAIHITIKTFII
jgi:alpha-mannosidase